MTDECVPALTKKGNYTSPSWAMGWNCRKALGQKPFNDAVIIHSCENNSTAPNGFVCVKHIRWGTQKDNNKEAIEKSIKNGNHVQLQDISCPHCNKIGKGVVMYRYHFDNCKFNTSL